ncbi:MAG: hypothetical protein ACXIVE_05925 [Salinarimonas sp.]
MTNIARRHAILSGDGAGLPARPICNDDESAGIHAQKMRIAARHTGLEPANDNTQWPLATALLREGNEELIQHAMAYRLIYDRAKSEAVLGGRGVSVGDGISLDQKVHTRDCGLMENKGVRGVAVREGEARQSVPVDEEMPERNFSKVPKPWNGDKPVNDMIDAKRELARLQEKLGHLCEPFEMSCIDGATYQEVGHHLRESHKVTATAVGRAVVHMALITIRDIKGKMKQSRLAA